MCRAEPTAAQGRPGGGFSLEDSKTSSMGEVDRIKFSMFECYFFFLIC